MEGLEELQKRIDEVSPDAFRRDSQWRMDALRVAVENAEGLLVVFARHMTDKTGKHLIFCSGQAHMKRVLIHAKGWFGAIDPEMHVYSAYSANPETSCAYKAFVKDDSGHLKLLFPINMLNEGVHVKGVSGVILFRQTESPIIYRQQIVRALTTGTQCTPLILDVVNNCTIQSEMNEAVERLRCEGRESEMSWKGSLSSSRCAMRRSCSDSLSTTWDVYCAAAEAYFAQRGDLLIPSQYVNEDGLRLGLRLHCQHRNKA